MRYIQKSQAPQVFLQWKKKNAKQAWKNVPPTIKAPLREELGKEQHGLCCYCCKPLKEDNQHIEHLNCRDTYPKQQLDYDNLLLSCSVKKQCGDAKANKDIDLHPLMSECETEITLNLAGELEGQSERAKQAIEVLVLNNRQLVSYRKSKIHSMRFAFDLRKPQRPVTIRDMKLIKAMMLSMDKSEQVELEYFLKKLTKRR